MISSQNRALNELSADADFTIEHYQLLLQLAVKNYKVVSYANIPWGERFILWRHDMDYSLNRGLNLAKIEAELGVKATYFINPHSEFYNIAEASQKRIIQEIISLGHNLGLHFDSAFYEIQTERDLSTRIKQDATYIEQLFDKSPMAFSFHNPSVAHLKFEANYYGDLLNCYSERFKSNVPYCSDSNGYWRFRRLFNVLSEATDCCLQVLTHPGWWQSKPMPPRNRIARSVYGRAADIMRFYDRGLKKDSRKNLRGESQILDLFTEIAPQKFELYDYLWNQGHLKTLYVDLWNQYQVQLTRLLMCLFSYIWQVPTREINTVFTKNWQIVDRWAILDHVFNESVQQTAIIHEENYRNWEKLFHQMNRGFEDPNRNLLVEGINFICQLTRDLAKWGIEQPFRYNGLECSRSKRLIIKQEPTNSHSTSYLNKSFKDTPVYDRRWIKFKELIGNSLIRT